MTDAKVQHRSSPVFDAGAPTTDIATTSTNTTLGAHQTRQSGPTTRHHDHPKPTIRNRGRGGSSSRTHSSTTAKHHTISWHGREPSKTPDASRGLAQRRHRSSHQNANSNHRHNLGNISRANSSTRHTTHHHDYHHNHRHYGHSSDSRSQSRSHSHSQRHSRSYGGRQSRNHSRSHTNSPSQVRSHRHRVAQSHNNASSSHRLRDEAPRSSHNHRIYASSGLNGSFGFDGRELSHSDNKHLQPDDSTSGNGAKGERHEDGNDRTPSLMANFGVHYSNPKRGHTNHTDTDDNNSSTADSTSATTATMTTSPNNHHHHYHKTSNGSLDDKVGRTVLKTATPPHQPAARGGNKHAVSTQKLLARFYKATHGDMWSRGKGWPHWDSNNPTTTAELHRYHGVSLNESERIIQLELNDNNLQGSLPRGCFLFVSPHPSPNK